MIILYRFFTTFLYSLANEYTTTKKITIVADAGTLMTYDKNKPPSEHAMLIITDKTIIVLNLLQYISAIIWGSVNKDISNITPISLMVSTIHSDTKTVIE